jgi:hypothetical protein
VAPSPSEQSTTYLISNFRIRLRPLSICNGIVTEGSDFHEILSAGRGRFCFDTDCLIAPAASCLAGCAPGKHWAGDPYAGVVRLFWSTNGSYWTPAYAGTRGSQQQTFTLYSPGYLRVGAAFRTRYPLPNNGFFLDDWALQRLY